MNFAGKVVCISGASSGIGHALAREFARNLEGAGIRYDADLNHDRKGNVKARGLPQTKEELRSLIQTFLRKLPHLPDHVMSCFRYRELAG